ncbi:hypothetical protein P4O66_007468 [Electrophorus voltai]|uniref:Centriolar coiled-coil protein of 110 kDa-like n=1 Tax=Electrophorus voltai TaxID=2609070 RepID=A0AAD9DXL0_9TELE|nr:hypothetical protein P4O66_007468 [Electrophorus voltai]
METYEQFYLRTLTKLESERKYEKNIPRQCTPPAFIYFHGRTVLSPLLSEKELEEMAQYRQRATRMEAKRQTCCKNNLINQVQKILDNRANAFTVTDPVGHINIGEEILTNNQSVSSLAEHPDALSRKHGEKIERDDEIGNKGIPNLCLLQRSREYIDKESCQRGLKVHSRSPVSSENKENDKASPMGETNSEPSCSVQYHSSFSSGQAKTFKKPKPINEATLGLDSLSGYSSHSLLNTDSALSPRPHRGRPLSAGNILLSYPLSPSEAGIVARGSSQGCGPLSGFEKRLLEGEGLSGSRRASHSGSSPLNELGGINSTPDPGQDLIEAGFRRRCHTLDSNLGPSHQSPPINRSQERVPRFMAGVLQRTPTRRSPPAQLSPPFMLEIPTSPQLRTSLSQDLQTSSCNNKQQLITEGNSVIGTLMDMKQTEEVQWQVQALEEIHRTMKEEHALQISLLMAEQEREQQHLRQELEEKGRQIRDQDGVCAVVGDGGGLQSPVTLGVIAPAIPSAAFLWGPNWALSKPRNRLSQDTQEFISTFHTEAPQKKSNLSNQDVSLQERVRAQLRAALFDIHDIFFAITMDERLALLAQDRELRAERKLREMEKAKGPKEKMILSAVTQKVLDRKKQRVGESPVQTRRAQQKPKSPLTSRSLHRKTPEERVKRSDSLKKQHSLVERGPVWPRILDEL